MSNKVTFSSRSILALIISLVIIGLLILGDLVEDVMHGETFRHLAVEFSPFFLVVCVIAMLSWRLIKATQFAHEKAEKLTKDLTASREDAVKWRAEAQTYIDGLSARIATQFSCWGLTPAEKEVAL